MRTQYNKRLLFGLQRLFATRAKRRMTSLIFHIRAICRTLHTLKCSKESDGNYFLYMVILEILFLFILDKKCACVIMTVIVPTDRYYTPGPFYKKILLTPCIYLNYAKIIYTIFIQLFIKSFSFCKLFAQYF